MNNQTIPVYLPQPLYQRLEKLARVSHHSVEDVVVQTLNTTIPSFPEHLPDELRDTLALLEHLEDHDLWQIARSSASREQYDQLNVLLEKNKHASLSNAEQEQLAQLRQQADSLMLQKAYAFFLLKWRGHRLPTLDELEAQG